VPQQSVLFVGAFAFVLVLLGTRYYIEYARANGVLDVPNERSSHSAPTPRGGGLTIAAATVVGLIVLWGSETVGTRALIGVLGGGVVVGGIGFLDDRRSVGAGWRLLSQFFAAAWLIWWLGDGALPATHPTLGYGVPGDLLALLFVVWFINLTNFMDGIDGLAGAETASVSLGVCVLAVFAATPRSSLAQVVVLGSASVGFLMWNWPPAKVFMGDVGSSFLGFMLAAIALQTGRGSMNLFWGFVILAGVFVVDATWTLLRRMLRGERFFQAHRSHAYQHAADRTGSHRTVTLAVLGINMLWLLPLSVLTVTDVLTPVSGIIIAYAPLVGVAILLGAGVAGRTVKGALG
jgi:Fuc2NAc and GlcNAc transferase